ncbi:uncharacterized protein TNCV_4976241 [Trichonephila clavipes]|nr:uncharacterized protein TNCV_4976241 [Trichonephila clavipes]
MSPDLHQIKTHGIHRGKELDYYGSLEHHKSTQKLTKRWSYEAKENGKKSENKNNSNVATEEKLNRLKDSIKGTLTRLETFTSDKTVSKDTNVTEIEIKLKKIEQLQINLDKIAGNYCEIETFESLEIIQLDIEDINQQIETTERDLQRIMWKTSADPPVKTYKLATVTYGIVSAPFLPTRTLKALTDEEKAEYPDAADVICNDSYMDDILSGESTLEEFARLYDPLGLIGPIVTKAKIFIQELWKIKLDWNEQLPPDAMEGWKNFYQKLSKVNNIKIPRCILLPATTRIEIHGFSDTSERAYAAVVHIKCFNESGHSQTRLLCSKSRVAPLKTLTIPRLELSAAILLSRLVKKVVPIL